MCWCRQRDLLALAFGVAIMHSLPTAAAGAAGPAAVRAYGEYLSSLKDIRLTFQSRVEDTVGDRVLPARENDWEVLNWSGHMYAVRLVGGSTDWISEEIYRDDRLLILGCPKSGERIASSVTLDDLRVDRQQAAPAPLGGNAGLGLYFGSLSKDIQKENAPRTIEEIAEAGDSSKIDPDNPYRFLVTAVTPHYELKIALRRDYGYAPESVLIVNRNPSKELKECTEVGFTASEFDRFDGVWFPRRVESTERYKAGRIPQLESMEGPAQVTMVVDTVESLALNESFSPEEFDRTISIKDGTPVNVTSSPHLRFKWMDGKVVPATDQEAMDRAMKAIFEKERAAEDALRPSYSLVLYLGVAAILFALTARIVIHLRSSKA